MIKLVIDVWKYSRNVDRQLVSIVFSVYENASS